MDDYYKTCPFPKPGKVTKKLLFNGYKDKSERYCYYCGTPYAERHEVYPGPNRQISIRFRFQVDLCHACHEEMQNNITPQAKERNEYWQKFYQSKYEKELMDTGVSKRKAREMWMSLIGKNFQGDIM